MFRLIQEDENDLLPRFIYPVFVFVPFKSNHFHNYFIIIISLLLNFSCSVLQMQIGSKGVPGFCQNTIVRGHLWMRIATLGRFTPNRTGIGQ